MRKRKKVIFTAQLLSIQRQNHLAYIHEEEPEDGLGDDVQTKKRRLLPIPYKVTVQSGKRVKFILDDDATFASDAGEEETFGCEDRR